MERRIFRGDVYFADLGPSVGSVQAGRRPVLVVQNNIGNRHSTTFVVACITSKMKPELPTHLPLSGINGLRNGSVVLLEQLRTIDVKQLERYVGSLNHVAMAFVDAGLAVSVALPQPHSIMTLCAQCARDHIGSGAFTLRRTDPEQAVKEPCTICTLRMGFDYEVIRK